MKVSLFVTCLTDNFYPRVGRAVVAVLEHLGYEVDFPPSQTCCGQPMFNCGSHADAAELARRWLTTFERSEAVVTPSGSCCAMVRCEYPHLFEHDEEMLGRVNALAARTYDFAEFLLKVAKIDLRELACRWPDGERTATVTYHYSCHLRGLGMTDETVRLLDRIEGVRVVPLEKTDQCCGFGGTFAVKYPQISGAMVADKTDCIRRSGAGVLVCNDGGCSLNITGRLHREGQPVTTKHIAEIIAEGLGLMPVELGGN